MSRKVFSSQESKVRILKLVWLCASLFILPPSSLILSSLAANYDVWVIANGTTGRYSEIAFTNGISSVSITTNTAANGHGRQILLTLSATGGGGGSGTLTNSAVSGGLLSLSGDSTVYPTFVLTTGTVQSIAVPLMGNSNLWNSAITSGVAGAGISLSVSGNKLYVTNTGVLVESDPVWAAASNLYRLSSTFGSLASSNSIPFSAITSTAALSQLPTGIITNPQVVVAGANMTSTLTTNAAGTIITNTIASAASSLSWQRWGRAFSGADIVPYSISNNWGMGSAKLDDGTYVLRGVGFVTYYTNASGTQLARGLVTFRSNPLVSSYTDTNNALAVSWFVAGPTNSANVSWFWRIYGNQENSSGQITNSLLIYTNTTAYTCSRASGQAEFTSVNSNLLFNGSIFPSYTFDFRPSLLATNPANPSALYIINGGGGM